MPCFHRVTLIGCEERCAKAFWMMPAAA